MSAELWLSSAVAAFGAAAAGREVRRRAEGAGLSPHYRTLLLAVLMVLGGDGPPAKRNRPSQVQRLRNRLAAGEPGGGGRGRS